MNFLVLNGPNRCIQETNHQYRGTERTHPTYFEGLPHEHEVNQLFFWYLEEGGESGVLHDLPKALRYANLLNQCFNNTRFEVIQAIDGNDVPTAPSSFLGFDLSYGLNTSLLEWGLIPPVGLQSLPIVVREKGETLFKQFGPMLNEYGLFQTIDTARACRNAMIELQQICENLFEGGDLSVYQVVALYLVTAAA